MVLNFITFLVQNSIEVISMKYYSINEFSKILGVSAQTLRNWDKSGKLHPHHTSSNGYRYYSHEQLNQIMNIKSNVNRITIGYFVFLVTNKKMIQKDKSKI